ncbi:MAG TPA: recombinase family protein, partial [Bellilinea sp.]|nr:recombinase family protein [Bellilinea sp.]
MAKNKTTSQKRTRYAIYARYSSDMQNEISLEDQEAVCREAIGSRGGVVVAVFKDGAERGWSLDREDFQKMQKAAEKGKFDALMVWKFDRLARDFEQSVIVKAFLRHEYKLKLHCVEGVSQDDDDSFYGAMIEQMLAVQAAMFSRNLSTDTKRAKRQRAIRGEFNGSIAPIGYLLVTKAQATEEQPAGLYIVLRVAAIVRRAFRMYSTGNYSDQQIADWMNQQPIIQELRRGQQPINKEMVRDMLQNRTYTGRVSYAETLYNGTLGESKQSSRGRKIWYDGKHQGFISDELFDICQEVRSGLARRSTIPSQHRTYILHDRVFCAECIANKPTGLVDDNYGKMRPFWHTDNEKAYYRCLARQRGYEPCGQPYIDVEDLDDQVVEILSNLVIPEGFRERVETAVQNRVDNAAALDRMAEIREIIERIDFRWDQGFISQEEYVEKRQQLQLEMDALRPIDYDELIEAADLIENFQVYWDQCENVDNPLDARQQLLQKIVERVFVHEGKVLAVVVHGDFGVVLGKDEQETADIARVLDIKNAATSEISPRSRHGSDGRCTLISHQSFLTCV